MPLTYSPNVQVTANDPKEDELDALILLHHRGLLTEATYFPNMQFADAKALALRIRDLNVGLAPYSERGYIIANTPTRP